MVELIFVASVLALLVAAGGVGKPAPGRGRHRVDAGARQPAGAELSRAQLAGVRLAGVRRAPELDVAALVVEVAARLRAGAAPPTAWRDALRARQLSTELSDEGVPAVLEVSGAGRRAPPGAHAAAQATRLAHELGAPLAQMLQDISETLAHLRAAAGARRIEFAGPRASARMLAGLPLAGLGLGALAGINPVAFFGSWAGAAVLSVGLTLQASGWLWTRAAIRKAEGAAAELAGVTPLALLAAALQTGVSLPGALIAVGRASGNDALTERGRMLLLGAPWEETWDVPAGECPDCVELGRLLEPAWVQGAGPVQLLHHAVRDRLLRRDQLAREAASRLGVRLVLPLGLCYLPAFVLLGVMPVVAQLAGGIFE